MSDERYADEKTVRRIERLRQSDKRRVAFENAADKWFFLKDAAGLRELEDLANKRTEPEKIDEEYLKRLSEMVQGLTDEQWERLKRARGG